MTGDISSGLVTYSLAAIVFFFFFPSLHVKYVKKNKKTSEYLLAHYAIYIAHERNYYTVFE